MKIIKRLVSTILKKFKPMERLSIPSTKPLSIQKGIFIYLSLTLLGLLLGSILTTYIFFGIIILAGLIAIIETNKYVKYIATRSNRLIDIMLFIFTMYATISLGITITASLTFAGLGYTLVYAPWLRKKKA